MRNTAKRLPILTTIADQASRRVAAQYEQSPYPSWLATTRRRRQSLAQVLNDFQIEPPDDCPDGPGLDILVAGCGTGVHAAQVATAFPTARVVAIDLSRHSLGYAARRSRQLGLRNIEFAQADILALGRLAGSFDVIECVGVLHHLAEPLKGWRRLRRLLRPQGLMRIAVYRRIARQRLASPRALARLSCEDATPQALRSARARIRAAAGTADADTVLGGLDFYDLNGLRDLLFHVQETAYDCPRIARELQALELEFLGFELPDPATLLRFRRQHPQRTAARDLALWDRFERANPRAFAGMYFFWCRNPAS